MVLPLDFYGFALRILTNLPFFIFFQGPNFLSLWQAVGEQCTLDKEVQGARRALEVQSKLHVNVEDNEASTQARMR